MTIRITGAALLTTPESAAKMFAALKAHLRRIVIRIITNVLQWRAETLCNATAISANRPDIRRVT
jgi:hypothetical protein